MTVETYVYSGPETSELPPIPDYAAKFERLREQIRAARRPVVIPGHEYQGPRGRRDILVDPRKTTNG